MANWINSIVTPEKLAPHFASPSSMPRKKVLSIAPGPFHIGARCINKEWFNLPMDDVWRIFNEQLYLVNHAFNLQTHCFILMSNHYHWIASTPELNLSPAVGYFQREVSRQLNREGNRINRTFADRFFRSHIGNYHYYTNCYKYVYQNPLRAGLVERVEDYKYSTLNGKLGFNHLLIPVAPDTLLFDGDFAKQLEWLNRRPGKEDEETMRKALRRGIFSLPKDLNTKKPHRLESELL